MQTLLATSRKPIENESLSGQWICVGGAHDQQMRFGENEESIHLAWAHLQIVRLFNYRLLF